MLRCDYGNWGNWEPSARGNWGLVPASCHPGSSRSPGPVPRSPRAFRCEISSNTQSIRGIVDNFFFFFKEVLGTDKNCKYAECCLCPSAPPASKGRSRLLQHMAGVKKYEENFLSFTHCYQQFGIYTGALHHYPSRSQLFRAVMQTRCRSRPRDGDHRLGGSDTTTAPACAAQLPPFFMHCGLSRSSRLFKKIPGPN